MAAISRRIGHFAQRTSFDIRCSMPPNSGALHNVPSSSWLDSQAWHLQFLDEVHGHLRSAYGIGFSRLVWASFWRIAVQYITCPNTEGCVGNTRKTSERWEAARSQINLNHGRETALSEVELRVKPG